MPTKPRKKATVYAEVEPALKERFEEFSRGRGNTFTAELEAAMLRHLTYPPPAPAPAPLPDSPQAAEAPVGRRRRKNSE